MSLKVKRILKYLIPIPFVILVICIAYLIKPLLQNAPAGGTESVSNENLEPTKSPLPTISPEEQTNEAPAPDHETPKEAETAVVVLSSVPLPLCDLYAEWGTIATFKCFYDGAQAYRWEYYDMVMRDWSEIEDVRSGYDDLGRQVSYVNMEASNENDGTMLRCRVLFPDMEIIETACLYVLDQAVTNIFVEDLSMDAQSYVYIHMIPVVVTYMDGTQEELTGLSGLHFLETKVKNVEEEVSLAGNTIETVTTVISEADHRYSDYGAAEVMLRYHPVGLSEAKKIDLAATFSGTDQNPPVISQVDFSDYRIGKEMAEMTVTITAEDDITPYPLLQYAVLPKGQELTEADWRNRSCFKKEFDKNGIWVIYCRDQYGNIGTYEKDIIVIDSDPPKISSVVLEKEGWNQSNTICVKASDALSLTYSYSCAETGEDSGFIARNEYEIKNNGTWVVRVMDAAGNVSAEKIYVSSIDRQSPVINGITTQKEEQ